MNRYQVQEFIKSWAIPITMFIGIFLIGVPAEPSLTGIILYGVGIHLCVLIMVYAIFDSEFYESVVEKIVADRKKKRKVTVIIKRAFLVASFSLFGIVLSDNNLLYLVVVTLIVLILFIAVQRVINDDVKRRIKNEVS